MNKIIATYPLTQQTRLEIVKGDLTQEPVEAIVNAANEHLSHGAGVAAAIAKAGGPSIQQESNAYVRQHGPVSHERPAITGAGHMPARYVIHAVGPMWGTGDEDRKLADAIAGSLALADQHQLKSIAFPAISTGIFGFPLERAARIFLETFQGYFTNAQPASGIEVVRLTLWDDHNVRVFQAEAERQLSTGAT